MKKLLYITTGLNTGGAEVMLYQLLRKLDRSQFEPTVISLLDKGSFGDRIESLDIPVYTINLKRDFSSLTGIMRLIRVVNRIKPDLIQGWMYHGNLAAQFVSFVVGFTGHTIPVFWSIHHSPGSLALEKKTTAAVIKFGAYIAHFPKAILFVSQVSQLQHKALGYASNHSYVIPNGFDTEIFSPSLTLRQEARSELGISPDCFLIGAIGRDHPMKDHSNFVRSAALLLKHCPNTHFVMIGRGLTPAHPTLQPLITALNLTQSISLLGERRDIPRLMASFDLFTSASAYGEAFPLVVGEAMSCAVPCVVTDVGDSGWIVGETGRVVPPCHSDALATAWKDLLTLSDEARRSLGQAARTRIVQKFSLESVVAQYESLYGSIKDTV